MRIFFIHGFGKDVTIFSKMLVVGLFLVRSCTVYAQGEAVENSYLAEVQTFSRIPLDTLWEYFPNGHVDFGRLNVKTTWTKANPAFLQDVKGKPLPWSGIGWFQQKFTVPDSLNGKVIALSMGHLGASEIYLDGKLISRFGDVFAYSGNNKSFLPRKPFSATLNNEQTHVLTVRYASHDFDKVIQPKVFLGFCLALAPLSESYIPTNIATYHGIFSMSLYIAFTVLFFFLYLFYPQRLASLITALYLLNFSLLFSSILIATTTTDASLNAWFNLLWKSAVSMVGGWSLLFIYSVYYQKMPRRAWLVVMMMIVNLYAITNPSFGPLVLTILNIIIGLETWRVTLIGIRDKRAGFWILAIGQFLGTLFFVLFIGDLFHLFSSPFYSSYTIIREIGGLLSDLSAPLMFSLQLAWEFGSSNRSLKEQLGEVQKLSIENLEQEQEKQHILATQNETLEKQVFERTAELAHKNRDLEIEAALDKIRSTSLAMRHSDEIQNVVGVLFEKLKELGLVFDGGAAIHLFTEGVKDAVIWVETSDQLSPTSKVSLPYDTEAFEGNPIILDVWNAHETGNDIVNKVYSFEEKNRYFNYVFKHNGYDTVPEFAQNIILQVEGYTASFVSEKHSLLGAASWSGQVFSEMEFDILKRVATVFEQAYVRFLDLQKAEAQAREAQIEAALEHVRSRTMAMQHSEELAEAANLLSNEVRKLGIPIWSCGYNIMEKDEKVCLGWMSTEGSIQPSFRIPLKVSPTFIKFYESRQNGVELFEEQIGGADLETHYKYMLTLDGFSDILKGFINSGHQLPTFQVNTVVNFTQGNLIFISAQPVSEAHDIFKRFAYVFEQTFTRFLDLQKAEAQSEQARLDLIQIHVEKKRAEEALSELKSTQAQLIQSEKLASLGELTAGIAHEIQNPLNFVNNFSELSVELIEELQETLRQRGIEATSEEGEILADLSQNQEKINHHGKRASSIVKGMLEHSRASTGVKELTDINKLADEYLRLSYHGLRAKDKDFNADYELIADENLSKIEVIPQDIGRVLLNLINNAFYAVSQRQNLQGLQDLTGLKSDYTPLVIISTQQVENRIIVKVSDNGIGMSEATKAKIFQPFFTTKPTGQGTGLGLSLAYDIVTKGHGGTLEVESVEGEGTTFLVTIPIKTNGG